MSTLHELTFIGNLGADPQLRFLDDKRKVLNIRVAVSEWVGEGQPEVTAWYNVPFWDERRIEQIQKLNLQKGDSVVVQGKPFYRTRIVQGDGGPEARLDIDIKYVKEFRLNFRRSDKAERAERTDGRAEPARAGTQLPATSADESPDDLPF